MPSPATVGQQEAYTAMSHPQRFQEPAQSGAVDSTQSSHPSALLLHYCILLTGFGTVFLGPMLPALTALLHLSDRGAGTLLAAQFGGAFLGGWTTAAPLRTSMLRGLGAAAIGFAALATTTLFAPSLSYALPALLLLGFGIGQTITSVNLLASAKWTRRRGAALNLLNFSWSFGALTAPVLLLRLLRGTHPSTLLYGFSTLLFLGLFTTLLWRTERLPGAAIPAGEIPSGLRRSTYLYFGFLLFLYGGVETSLGGWLTTFDHRYAPSASWQGMALSTAAFWASLTAARLLTPVLLSVIPERVLLRLGLCVATVALLLMLVAHSTAGIAACAAVAGFSLSPWFPLVLSVLVSQSPTASQAGRVIAISGLGAAALPWLVGQLSAASGSLRIALLLPALGIVALLCLSFSPLFGSPADTPERPAKSV